VSEDGVVTRAKPRVLLRGGYVHTPADPHATAVCIEDGAVVWTGDDDASVHFADHADRVVDLDGRLVTPAFVDAHVHLSQTGMRSFGADLSASACLGEALDALAAHTRGTSFPVVLGLNWDETRWPEGRPFTREEVDRAVGDKPAYLARVDAHSAVVSSAFLDAFPALVDLEGYAATGLVSRQANIAARDSVFLLVPDAAQEDAIALALADAARAGIGMVHEMGAPGDSPAEDFARIAAVTERRPLPEVVGYWGQLDAVDYALELGCAGAAGDLCVDGAIGSRTAALLDPYADAETSGHLYLDADEVRDHVVACTKAGIQAGFHVIGDRAMAAVVSGLSAAADVVGAPAIVQGRHRLEHAEMVTPEEMATLGRLGVTASMQPLFDGYWGGPDSLYAQRLGAERARPMNAFASMNRAGVPLAFGSDTPVTPFAPWASVRAAAWHHTETERITVRAAFNAHTRGGWRAARRDEGGVIAPGAPASIAVWDVPGDLVVQTPDARVAAWSTDPRAGVPQLPDLHPDVDLPTCVLTLVQGEIAFEEEGAV
jgi:predicted amidohydrolase YtcJ